MQPTAWKQNQPHKEALLFCRPFFLLPGVDVHGHGVQLLEASDGLE